MAQVFPQWANRAPLLIAVGFLAVGGLAPLGVWYFFSPELTHVGYRPIQPVPFSHVLHVGELEMDCRYCHVNVERSAVASVPSTRACMSCHQTVGRELESLAPVRASLANAMPIQWVRVHKVPEYAFFPHDLHLRAGIGCSSCHGDIASMERVMQVEPLSMGWCLDCHRDPTPHLRPLDEIFDTRWRAPEDQPVVGARLLEERRLAPPVDCSACHF